MNDYTPAPGIGAKSPAENDDKPAIAAALMLKDPGLAMEAVAAAGADTPLGAGTAELYRIFVEEEDGRGHDFSAMPPRFEKRGRK